VDTQQSAEGLASSENPVSIDECEA